MPIPTPQKEEKEQDFISRCMKNENMQKYGIEQRSAICYTKYKSEKNKNIKSKLYKEFSFLETSIIRKLEKLASIKKQQQILAEIPLPIMSYFSPKGAVLFKTVYLKNRLAGREKKESLSLTKAFTLRNDLENRLGILKSVEKELKEIIKKKKESFYENDYEEKREEIVAVGTPDEEYFK